MNYAHLGNVSDYPIACNPLAYLKRVNDWPGGIAYHRPMLTAAFDPQLVREKMREQRVSQKLLAEVAGMPTQSAISEALSGKRQVKVQEAAAIYRFLGISPIDGVGVVAIPVIGLAAAGKWREAIEMPLGRITVPKHIAGARAFAVEIVGTSINLLVKDGGWIVVDPDDKALVADKCYLIQNEDYEVTVKQYQRNPARFVPVSDDPEHQGFEVGECDFVVLGRVVWRGERM